MDTHRTLSNGDIIAIVAGIGFMLVLALILGALGVYGVMKNQPKEVQFVETNNTIIIEKNITVLKVINITEEEPVYNEPRIEIYANGSINIPESTTTTMPGFRIDSDGKLLPEDAQRLMDLAIERLKEQTTTTSISTTTTIKRLSTAPMYGLYNPFEATNFDGQFLVNRSVEMTLKAIDGSGKWSHGISWRMDPVTPAEARYYSNNIGDSGVEEVWYQSPDGNMTLIDSITWSFSGG